MKKILLFILGFLFLINLKIKCQESINNIFDIDKNIYHTIKIGSQLWMTENLSTTHFNDGSKITLIEDNEIWMKNTSSGYCWYDNNSAKYKKPYGAIYNWYAVSTGKLCPNGWHVPTENDWKILIEYLGGNNLAGGKMKEKGTEHWMTPNTRDSLNNTLNILPNGMRDNNDGVFKNIGKYAYIWSSTEDDLPDYRVFFLILYQHTYITRCAGISKFGISVRCMKSLE